MEESKELQSLYKIFRTLIYVALVLEVIEYAFTAEQVQACGDIVYDVWSRIKRWTVYEDGHIVYSKIMTFLIVCITCVGTRNKKQLEFDMRSMVLYPFVGGLMTLVMAVCLFFLSKNDVLSLPVVGCFDLGIWFYIITSIVGTILIHVALDNISKFLKEGLMKDRFNFENESFQQMEKLEENDYSVNIPMRYYFKGRFRKGFINFVNPFRGI